MKTKHTFALVSLSLILLSSCNGKKKESAVISPPSGTAVTSAELIGTYDSNCIPAPSTMGTNFNNHKIRYMLSVDANETISLNTAIHTSSTCLGSPIHMADYTGTMTVVGVSSTLAGGTNITFTGNSITMRPYNTTVKGWYDSLCYNGTDTFGSNGSTSTDVTGRNCNFLSSGMGPVSFHSSNATIFTSAIYNSQLSSPTLQMHIGQDSDWVMFPGSGAYPSAVNVTFTKR